jgi:hypothetical protein
MTIASEVAATFVIGFLLICGLGVAWLASQARLEAEREETEKLRKRNSELEQSVQRLPGQMDQSIAPGLDVLELIQDTPHTSTNGYVSVGQSA